MIKVFCDYCGCEIDTTTYRVPTKSRIVEILTRHNDICPKCKSELTAEIERKIMK